MSARRFPIQEGAHFHAIPSMWTARTYLAVLAPPLDRTVHLHAPRLLLDLGLQGLGGRRGDGDGLGPRRRACDGLRHGAYGLLPAGRAEHHAAGPRGSGGLARGRVAAERERAH